MVRGLDEQLLEACRRLFPHLLPENLLGRGLPLVPRHSPRRRHGHQRHDVAGKIETSGFFLEIFRGFRRLTRRNFELHYKMMNFAELAYIC